MSITTRDKILVTATTERLIEIKLGRETFHLLPGTAQGLREMITAAMKDLFPPMECPRGITPIAPGETLHFNTASIES